MHLHDRPRTRPPADFPIKLRRAAPPVPHRLPRTSLRSGPDQLRPGQRVRLPGTAAALHLLHGTGLDLCTVFEVTGQDPQMHEVRLRPLGVTASDSARTVHASWLLWHS